MVKPVPITEYLQLSQVKFSIVRVNVFKVLKKANRPYHYSLVRLEGIEPPSTVPKTVALSVELQTHNVNLLKYSTFF